MNASSRTCMLLTEMVVPKIVSVMIVHIKCVLNGPEASRMKPQTLKIPTTLTLQETCAGSMNDICKTTNCVAPPVIDGNVSQNANQFDLLPTHTSFTAAPLVAISGMISVIIGAPRQAKIIVQGQKKVGMMTSPTMLSCPALVLACITHANSLCNKEEGALAFEKVVRHFLSCMLLLALACS